MAGTETVGVSELLGQHENIFIDYERLSQEADRFRAADQAIGVINATIDPGKTRLVTVTGPHHTSNTYVYEKAAKDEYSLRNKVQICGAMLHFIGDTLKVIDGRLVLVDTELGGGISVSGWVDEKPTEKLYESIERDNYGFLLKVLAGLQPGENRPIEVG